MFYKSLIFLTTKGKYIHISDVDEIQHKPFTDEGGLINELADSHDPLLHIWVKVGEESHVLELKDQHNAASIGINASTYSSYSEMPTEEKIARKIVDVWASIKYPKYKNYYRIRQPGDFE